MPLADSPRKVMMDTFRQLCRDVRGGVYFTKRGPIDWSSFNCGEQERAIAILIDDHSFMKDINDASITFEIAGRMIQPEQRPDLDDGLLDEFIDDAEWIIRSLIDSVDTQGDPVVLKAGFADARIVEFHDVQLRVQGIIAFIEVSF